MAETICVWGASSSYGVGDQELGGWVNRLRIYLDNKKSDHYRVFNLGISGEPSTEIINRFDSEAKDRKPDIIIFGLGSNDASYLLKEKRTRTSKELYRDTVENLIKKSKKYTDNILFVGTHVVDEDRTNPIPWNDSKSFLNKYIQQFEEIIEKLVKKYNLQYINLQKEFKNMKNFKEFLFIDGLHPNSEGHQLIFEKVKDKLGI